jgi:hypothetical protein
VTLFPNKVTLTDFGEGLGLQLGWGVVHRKDTIQPIMLADYSFVFHNAPEHCWLSDPKKAWLLRRGSILAVFEACLASVLVLLQCAPGAGSDVLPGSALRSKSV